MTLEQSCINNHDGVLQDPDGDMPKVNTGVIKGPLMCSNTDVGGVASQVRRRFGGGFASGVTNDLE